MSSSGWLDEVKLHPRLVSQERVVVQFEWEVPQRLKPKSTHSLIPRLKPGVYPRAIAKLHHYPGKNLRWRLPMLSRLSKKLQPVRLREQSVPIRALKSLA